MFNFVFASYVFAPLKTERETGSDGTVLADYESDLERFSHERLVPVIIQPGGAPSHHDPNEALDQISVDNLTQDAPADEDEVTRTAHRERNQCKEVHRTRAAERAHLPPRNLNNEFNNAANPIFRTPIAANDRCNPATHDDAPESRVGASHKSHQKRC